MSEKVLIIDNDTDTLRLADLMLQHPGYASGTASSGEHGIAMATLVLPEVILLYVKMPAMDAGEVAHHLMSGYPHQDDSHPDVRGQVAALWPGDGH